MNAAVLHRASRIDAKTHPAHRAMTPMLLRAALVVGCALSVAAVAIATDRPELLRSAPELARLLRGMALLKGVLALAAVAVLLWRFGQPIRTTVATGYLAGALLMTGSTALIWQLAALLPAATAFHLGLFTLLAVAWRADGGRRTASAH